MFADIFRHFYDYHFFQNRHIWDAYIVPLPQEQFLQPVDYSHSSVCNQIVHMINADNVWFSDLRGAEFPGDLDPADFEDRRAIRARWDGVEQMMRAYLDDLRDDTLFDKPLQGEDADLTVWQVLLHVVNHGTDHRAQVLRVLHDLGADTRYQDYIFYVYGNPTP